MTPTKKSDFTTVDLPQQHRTVRLDRTFSPAEMQQIQLGLYPQEMEDKWFIYWQDNTLFFHRSWTGFCVYVVRFAADGKTYRMFEADLNRDSQQYTETSDGRDAAMISYLIDVLLLRRVAEFPCDDSGSGMAAIQQWSQVGQAMFGHHPTNEDHREQKD